MNVLWITGAGGVVGTKLVIEAIRQGHFERIYAFVHTPHAICILSPAVKWLVLDISDREAVQAAARINTPTVIINAAAMTNVDACEMQPHMAQRINSEGPRYLAEVSCQHDAHLLHLSTDYIFPGDDVNPGPYREDSTPRPVNCYGRTKLGGERAVLRICKESTPCTIVRTALVYDFITGGRINFISWLLSELGSGRRVRVVRDQWNTPTLADDIASILLWLAEHHKTGVYHVAGPDLVGRHELALSIAQHFALDSRLIEWVVTSELGQMAKRPRYSGLQCERLQAEVAQGAPRPRGIAQALDAVDWSAVLRSQQVKG